MPEPSAPTPMTCLEMSTISKLLSNILKESGRLTGFSAPAKPKTDNRAEFRFSF